MFKKMKLRKLLKKIQNRKRQLEWIKKKRKLIPEPVQKRIVSNLESIEELEKNFVAKKATCEEAEKISYEIDHNFKLHFNKYKQNGFMELVDELWLVVLIALILKFFVIGSFRVPTGSMVDTIEIGDNLFVAMFVYGLTFPFAESQFVEFSDPARGEIITFTEPEPQKKALVKRVVGIPGDTILLSGTDVYVNGNKLAREFSEKTTYTSSRGDKMTVSQFIETNENGREYKVIYNDAISENRRAEIEQYCKYCNRSFTVPKRNYFVMGDNRDDSLDSRYWGFVPRENLQGKPLFVWFSIQFGQSVFDVIDLRLKRIGHVFAVWIEKEDGSYIQTLGAWARNYKSKLQRWASKSSYGSIGMADAITGASRMNHSNVPTLTWKIDDITFQPAENGIYNVYFELNETNFNSKSTTAKIQIGEKSEVIQTNNIANIKDINISFK